MRLRDTFVIEDLQGREVATIREKKLVLRESMKTMRAGATIATVYKAHFTPFRNKFTVDVEGTRISSPRGYPAPRVRASAAEKAWSPAYRSTGSR